MNKSNIYRSFQRSLATYNQNAIVQNNAINTLVRLIQEQNVNNRRVFEIGCGTGMLTTLLLHKYNIETYYCNDLVKEVNSYIWKISEKYLDTNIQFISGDITKISIPQNLDLIVSSSTLQWIDELDALFHNLKLTLNKGGIFAFSTYGPENMIELKTLNHSGLDYKSLEDVKTIASSHFEILHASQNIEKLTFDTVSDVLKHLRNTGVNGFKSGHWTKSKLQNFIEQYTSNFSTHNGIELSYHPMFFILKVR